MIAHKLSRRLATLVGSTIVTLALLAGASSASALAEGVAHWGMLTRSAPQQLTVGKAGEIVAVIPNLGDAPVFATHANPVVVTDTLPANVTLDLEKEPGKERPRTPFLQGSEGANGQEDQTNPLGENCSKTEPVVRCTFEGELPPLISLELRIPVKAEAEGTLGENRVAVEGAEVAAKFGASTITAGTGEAHTPFGVERYELTPEAENGATELQAGAHPSQLTTAIGFKQTFGHDKQLETGFEFPGTSTPLRGLNDDLPPGLLGNTTVVPQCTDVEFSTVPAGNSNQCPGDTALGVAVVTFREPNVVQYKTVSVPVFNLVPAPGEPARFGFEFEKVPIVFDTSVRTGEGYGVKVSITNSSQTAEVTSSFVTIWGVPGASVHDDARGWACLGGGFRLDQLENVFGEKEPCVKSGSTTAPPFLTLPTTCEKELETSVEAESWLPGATFEAPVKPSPMTLQGCSSLPFEPSVLVKPTQTVTSTPTGMNVDITVPQDTTLSAKSLAEADIKATTLALPEGLSANAGAATGLETCSTGESGFIEKGGSLSGSLSEQDFNAAQASCQNASKIGEVTIHSPLLENNLTGAVYLGSQDTNPFASPLVLYMVAHDPVSGVLVKFAGEVIISPTGQLTSVFRNTPPVPFETLELSLFDGPRASQVTPAYCRTYESTTTFATWSSEAPTTRSSSFRPTSAPNGTTCQEGGALPFSPSLQAGSNAQAAAFTPFTTTIKRADGQQALEKISLETPPGLAAVLASVPQCANPQAVPLKTSSSPCPQASQIGETTSASGLGGDPVTLHGQLYLTEGYGGAPFGLLAVTEAKAGPFNLGFINVRSQIFVNRETSAATVISEQIPKIVDGVPTQLKELTVNVNRAGFEFNPTNCDPTNINGTLNGYEGGNEVVSSPFQVKNCATLPFAPKFTATVAGQGSKEDGTTFTVTTESPGLGQAGIHKVDLTIPALLPSRLTTIQKACLEKVFNANPASCDEGSVIGEGTITTPVFKNPLHGPAYLVSHGNAAFPDVEFVLQGEGLEIILDGKTDIKKGVTYSKFETLPDAPFTRFVSNFPAGPHSALTTNVPEDEHYSLCRHKLTIPYEVTGQNGAFFEETIPVRVLGCSGVHSNITKKLSNAQLLAKALKACKKDKSASKRAACEKAAHKKYGPKGKKSSKKNAKNR